MDIHKVRSAFLNSIKRLLLDYEFGPGDSLTERLNRATKNRMDEVLVVARDSGAISESLLVQVRRAFLGGPSFSESELLRLLSIVDCHLEYCEAGRSEVAGQ